MTSTEGPIFSNLILDFKKSWWYLLIPAGVAVVPVGSWGHVAIFSLLKFPVKVNYTLTWPRSEKPAIYKILLSKALKVSIGGISPKCPWRALLCKNLCFSKLWTSAFFKFRHMKWCHLPDIFRKDFKSSFWKCKNWKS